MQFRNFMGALVTVAAACLAFSAPANAQIHNIMTFSGGQPPTGNYDFSFASNGTGGGTLVTTGVGGTPVGASGVTTGITSAFLNFGPISMVSGSATIAGGDVVAQFGGGSFSVTTLAGGGGINLLTGTFGGSDFKSSIAAPNGATLQTITFGSVVYTSGQYLTEFLTTYGGTSAIGSFSIGLTAITPTVSIDGFNGLNSFDAEGSGGTFDATSAVPEPGEYAVMGLAGLTVCGLMIRARRRRSASGMAS